MGTVDLRGVLPLAPGARFRLGELLTLQGLAELALQLIFGTFGFRCDLRHTDLLIWTGSPTPANRNILSCPK
jgi:hypothetical protein